MPVSKEILAEIALAPPGGVAHRDAAGGGRRSHGGGRRAGRLIGIDRIAARGHVPFSPISA